MDLPTLVQTFGPTFGGIAFIVGSIAVSFFKFVWPRYEKHLERRTRAEEKQATAFERIADLSEQSLALQRDIDRKLNEQQIGMAVLLDRKQVERPTRNRKLTAPQGAPS